MRAERIETASGYVVPGNDRTSGGTSSKLAIRTPSPRSRRSAAINVASYLTIFYRPAIGNPFRFAPPTRLRTERNGTVTHQLTEARM